MTTPLDTPWKQILESYFPQFMAFFFPEAYSQIDWGRGFEFLAWAAEAPHSGVAECRDECTRVDDSGSD